MRVICGQCNKAYAVADHLIPAKGARAQCPLCGHKQLIKKEEGAAAVAPAPAPPPQQAAPREPPRPQSAPRLDDPDLGLDLPGAPASPAAAPPTWPEPPVTEPAPRKAAPTASTEAAVCDVCGTPISSPFDVALGMCERCQSLASRKEGAQRVPELDDNPLDQLPGEASLAGAPAAPPPPAAPLPTLGSTAAAAPQSQPLSRMTQTTRESVARSESQRTPTQPPDAYRFRKVDGTIVGPFLAAEIQERLEKGEIAIEDEVSRGTDSFRKWIEYPPTLHLMRRLLEEEEERRERRGKKVKRLAIAGGAGLAVAGVALFATVFQLRRSEPPVDAALKTLVAAWRAQFGDSSATAEELIRAGREHMAQDSPSGYRAAIQAFKRALIARPTDVRAQAGFVEAVALSWNVDDVLLREANVLSGQLAGVSTPEAHRARAHLYLSFHSDAAANEAQAEGTRARQLGGEEAATLAVLGRANLAGNAPSALELLTRALAKDASMRRAMLWRAEAELSVGRLASATATLRARVELDPSNPEPWVALARARLAAGDIPGAGAAYRSALQSDPRHFAARVGLAALAYQSEGDRASAAESLAALRAEQARLSHSQRAVVLLHSAILARESGDAASAVTFARAAVAADPESPGVHFQLALALLASGDAKGARAAAQALDPLVDAGRKSDLVARVEAALGRPEAALTHYAAAIDLAPHRIDPILRAAALFAQSDRISDTLAMLRRALDTDPKHQRDHAAPPEQFETSRDLAHVRDVLKGLLARTDQKELVRAGLAVVHYHMGEMEAARADLAAAGDSSLAVHVYRAQMALDENKPAEALRSALAAMRVDRLAPVGGFLAAQALVALGRPREARTRLREALEADPHFLPALALDGMLAAEAGERDRALERLLKVWRADPENLAVRRAIDRLGY